MAKRKATGGSGKRPPPAKRKTGKKARATRKRAVKAPAPAPKPLVARAVLRRPVKDRPTVKRLPGARPAPHKAPAPSANIFERDLEKTPANFAALTPLQFLERSASVFPKHPALVHGARVQSWAETYTRCRRLASALASIASSFPASTRLVASFASNCARRFSRLSSRSSAMVLSSASRCPRSRYPGFPDNDPKV